MSPNSRYIDHLAGRWMVLFLWQHRRMLSEGFVSPDSEDTPVKQKVSERRYDIYVSIRGTKRHCITGPKVIDYTVDAQS